MGASAFVEFTISPIIRTPYLFSIHIPQTPVQYTPESVLVYP